MDKTCETETLKDLLTIVRDEMIQELRQGCWYVDTLPPTEQQCTLVEFLNTYTTQLFGGMTDEDMVEFINKVGEENEGT